MLALCLVVCIVPTWAVAGQWWDTAAPPIINGHQMPVAWWEAAKRSAIAHKTDPFRIAATAAIESDVRKHGWYHGKIGMSRYNAPMGFSDYCRQSRGGGVPDEVLDNPILQIEWAGRLLCGNLERRLCRYNTNPQGRGAYVRAVLILADKFKWQARQMAYGW